MYLNSCYLTFHSLVFVCDINLAIMYTSFNYVNIDSTDRRYMYVMLVCFLSFQENGAEVLGVETEWEHTFIRNWLLNFDIERQEQLKQRKSESMRS